MAFEYNNITISGGIAVGTSTLVKNLKHYLAPAGWRFFSGGEFMRDYAIRHGLIPRSDPLHHMATVYSDEFDRQVDNDSQERLKKEKNLVIEAWLAGFFNRNNSHVLKVLLICSNDDIRVDRLANRENISIEVAKHQLRIREETNFKKWQRLYGDYNFFDPKYYNLIIDTYNSGPIETAGKVLDTLGFIHDDVQVRKDN